jgi:hypothetical protein
VQTPVIQYRSKPLHCAAVGACENPPQNAKINEVLAASFSSNELARHRDRLIDVT